MAQFIKVGSTGDFKERQSGKLVEAAGRSIAVFSVGGSFYAIDNACTHRGGPLSEGSVEGEEVVCPWHQARFNIKTGAVLEPPATEGVKSYPVRISGEDVEVQVD